MAQSYRQQLHDERVNHWRTILEAWQSSGSNIKDYCKSQNISISQFKYWQYHLALDTKRNYKTIATPCLNFAEAKVVSPPLSPPDNPFLMELITQTGYRVRLAVGFDESSLSRLLGLLGRLP